MHGIQQTWLGDLFIEIKLGFAGWINVFFCLTRESQSGDLVRLWRIEGQNNIPKILRTSEHNDTQESDSKKTEKSNTQQQQLQA